MPGMSERGTSPSKASGRAVSALPSVQARVLGFLPTLVAGVCGALIGYSFVSLQCHGACSGPNGIGAIVGGAFAAGGVAVISVLVLRAMSEWRTIKEQRDAEAPGGAAGKASGEE